MANISVEPVSLVEKGRRLPSAKEVDGEEEGSEIVWRFPERRHRGCEYRLVSRLGPC